MSSHLRRFYVDEIPDAGDRREITGDEAHHISNVVRLRPGEELTLLDGSGREARARLVSVRRGVAVVEVLDVAEVDREAWCRLTVATAVPRGLQMDFLVQKCCELGVARLIPVLTERGVVDPTRRGEHHLTRWRRLVREATKQCGRTRLMEVEPPASFGEAVEHAGPDDLRLIATLEPDAIPLGKAIRGMRATPGVFALVGPEGGFTPGEVALARRAGFRPISLGARVLRVETAALAIAAVILISGDGDS